MIETFLESEELKKRNEVGITARDNSETNRTIHDEA